jgi:hypothetical protein
MQCRQIAVPRNMGGKHRIGRSPARGASRPQQLVGTNLLPQVFGAAPKMLDFGS